MPGTHDVRGRLLTATLELIREGGLGAASPAAVADRAGAGKMSLYRHFQGKDDLVGEALREYDAPHRAHLLGPAGAPPREQLLGLFDRAAGRADRPGFTGCPYVCTRLELHDPRHPAVAATRAHKGAMIEDIGRLLARLGDPAPDRTARVVLMLLDGALLHAVIAGNGGPLRDARAAVAALLPAGADPDGQA